MLKSAYLICYKREWAQKLIHAYRHMIKLYLFCYWRYSIAKVA